MRSSRRSARAPSGSRLSPFRAERRIDEVPAFVAQEIRVSSVARCERPTRPIPVLRAVIAIRGV